MRLTFLLLACLVLPASTLPPTYVEFSTDAFAEWLVVPNWTPLPDYNGNPDLILGIQPEPTILDAETYSLLEQEHPGRVVEDGPTGPNPFLQWGPGEPNMPPPHDYPPPHVREVPEPVETAILMAAILAFALLGRLGVHDEHKATRKHIDEVLAKKPAKEENPSEN